MDAETREYLREMKDDILTFAEGRFDGIDGRLDRVNGRLDKHSHELMGHHGRLKTVEEQAKNLGREVFKRLSADERPKEAGDGVKVEISEKLLRRIASPKVIGWVIAALYLGVESFGHLKRWIGPLITK